MFELSIEHTPTKNILTTCYSFQKGSLSEYYNKKNQGEYSWKCNIYIYMCVNTEALNDAIKFLFLKSIDLKIWTHGQKVEENKKSLLC